MRGKIKFLVILLVICNSFVFAQGDSLRTKIAQIAEQAKGKVGVAVINLKNDDTLTFNGNEHFPMQSVFKFPLALAVLNKVDKGELSLDKQIFVSKEDLIPRTWSPLREKYPEGNIFISLDEIISYTVSQSDNSGCDILFKLIGGTEVANNYIHSLGIEDIAIVNTESEMSRGWEVQYNNWSSPLAMAKLLNKFYWENILSKKSKDYLWKLMVNTSTGPKRIKGLLPKGTVVAHKTGTSGVNEDGIAAATNDVGIIQMEDGSGFVIVVFVSDSPETEEIREGVIAQITKTVYDSYIKHNQ